MHQDKSIEDFRYFINWALSQRDLDFLDDVSRFLRQLYVLAQIQNSGNEYVCQLEQMQNAAHRLIRSAERLDRCVVPICIQILATMSRTERAMQDIVCQYVPVACEALELPELDVCKPACQCSDSSLPPT